MGKGGRGEGREEWKAKVQDQLLTVKAKYNSLTAALTGTTVFAHHHFSQFEDEVTRVSVCLPPLLERQSEDEQEDGQTATHD